MSAEPSTSTIMSLPNEVLLAIAAAGQEGRVPDPQTPSNLKLEWTLSQVSRRLRTAIVGSPTLWTLVEVDLDAEGSVERSKLYLARSGACNISATILQRSPLGDTERYLVRQLLNYMVPHADRISWLCIELSTEWTHSVLAPFRGIAAPNLQHLEMARDKRDISNESGVVEIFLPGAPKLVFVKLDRLLPFPAVPPWTASLTHLELWGGVSPWGQVGTWSPLVEIMRQCPSLAHLHIDIQRFPTGLRLPIPSLKSLHVSISDGADTEYLLAVVNIFDTPALTDLTVNHTHGDQICRVFTSTGLQSSFPVLSSISFIKPDVCSCVTDDPMIFSPTIASPPHFFPALSSLTLINQCLTNHIVHNIVGLHPWPLLKIFTLSVGAEETVTMSLAIQRAVRLNRQRDLHTLPRFRLSQALFSELASAKGLDLDQEIFDPEDVLDAFRSA
ncbi:hypothetical protein C8R47DRAFT_1147711 [Mycena vitilis]|nr:hypothetical protein C8R47DRAFT_1147711 [Mycena vitilis]